MDDAYDSGYERAEAMEMAQDALTDLAEALDRLHRCIVHDARDWSMLKRDALTYALVIGWGDDAAWSDVARRHGWSPDDIAELKRLNAAIDAHKGTHKP